jgi:DNA-directed RNA polymerase specialized sigma24 family protein
VKAIALFFFFSMLDEKRAIHASAEAFEVCLRKIEKNPEIDKKALLVLATEKIWKQHRRKLIRGRPQYSLDSGWKLPDNLDLGLWKEFQKSAPEEELLALIWSRILGFSDQEVSAGLGVTEGTVRFRVGRALRKLGSFNRQNFLTVAR